MLYYAVSVAYTVVNLLVGLIVYLKSRQSLISQFYFICVCCLCCLGAAAVALREPMDPSLNKIVTQAVMFVYALLPFFFMHFITLYVRRAEPVSSRGIVIAIYGVGLFAYTMILLGFVPRPISAAGRISQSGYVFYVTWMSIFFSIGISLLYEMYRGFRTRVRKGNILFIGFMVLLLVLPGPFTDSVFFGILQLSADWYFYLCTCALVVAVYFIFRHKIIVNTIYDALKSALEAMNDIFLTTNAGYQIEMIRGSSTSAILGYEEHELLGRSFIDLTEQKAVLEEYRSAVAAGTKRDGNFDVDMLTRDGGRVAMNFSFTPMYVSDEFAGFVGVGRDISSSRHAEQLRETVYSIAQAAEESPRLTDLFGKVHELIGRVMPANNFYIALYDEKKNLLSFPYFVDEVDVPESPRPPGKGLTEYVLRTGMPLLCDHATEQELQRRGEIELVGTPSPVWLGVPLNAGKKAIGVMAVQHYSDEHAYGPQEQYILEYVSSQVAKEIERKQANEQLRLLGHMIEGISEIVTITDLNDNLTFVNNAFLEKYGYTRDEILGRHVSTLWSSGNDPQLLREVLERNRKEGWEGELINVTRTGREFPIHLTTTRIVDENNHIVGLVGVSQDISEKRKAEEALRSSEAKFRSLFETVPDGVYQSTPGDDIITANPALARMLGYESSGELLALNIARDLYKDPEEREILRARLDERAELRNIEVSLRKKNGDPITVLENIHVVKDDQEAIRYYEGTVTDITNRKRLEEELRQAQKMESLGTLAGGIAHDFNNILQIILVNSSSLRRDGRDPEKIQRLLDINLQAVERGATLVQQVLTFARKTEVRFVSLNVNTVIRDLLKMLSETFPKTVTFVPALDPELPAINADQSQVHQVLLNLCVNARDAMPHGGRISIGTARVPGEEVRKRFAEAEAPAYVLVTVTDTGQGMDEKTRSRIFEPFFTTKEKGKGTGLGLAVVYGIINTHRGFIEVTSKAGFGTTFRIYLPMIQDAERSSAGVPQAERSVTTGSETILVVEDEEILLSALSSMLEGSGYTVLVARDGVEALEIFRSHSGKIGLVITDIGLPRLSGWDAVTAMREIHPGIPVIVSSGYLDPQLRPDRIAALAEDVILKPYRSDDILVRVRKVLDRGRAVQSQP